jgi:hypothetical protein
MILISDLQNIQNHGLTLYALNNSWLPSSVMWELPLQYTTPSKLFEPNSKCFATMTFQWLSKFLTGFHVQHIGIRISSVPLLVIIFAVLQAQLLVSIITLSLTVFS